MRRRVTLVAAGVLAAGALPLTLCRLTGWTAGPGIVLKSETIGLAIMPFSRRARVSLLAAFLFDSVPAWSRSDHLAELPRSTAFHLLDRSAYAVGVWREMIRRRDFRALKPVCSGDRGRVC